MIVGNIKQLDLEKNWLPTIVYQLLHKAMEMDLVHLAPGRYELGKSHYMNIDEGMTEPEQDRLFEAHQEYADVQLVLKGREIIGYAPLWVMGEPVKVWPDKDVMFYDYKEKYSKIPMTEGTFAIFFPGDAHKPLIADGKVDSIKKVIIKVSLNKII